MGTRYQTYEIDCSRGGLNGNPNVDALPSYAMVAPTRNINIHLGTRMPRGGTSHVDADPITGTPQILGGHDYRLKNGNQFIMRAASDGNLYKNATDVIKSGLNVLMFPSMVTADDCLFHCNGFDVPQVWNGVAASASDISEPAADWTTDPPIQFLLHGRGASKRLWALNKNGLFASKNFTASGDFQKFVTGAQSIRIDTQDGFGLQGMIEQGSDLFFMGKKKTYRLDDSDATPANWGYEPAPWFGGVSSWRLLVQTPNDIIAMMDDGEVYSISAVQEYGDYKAASLTRPAFMHKWIADNVNLDQIDKFHAVYDPIRRAVMFFVAKTGAIVINAAILFFIDRPPAEAWMVHDNASSASGYDASCSFMTPVSNRQKIYTGDYSGNLWVLQTENKDDNGNGFYSGFKTPPMHFENPRTTKDFNALRAVMQPEGEYDLSYKFWADGILEGNGTISLSANGEGSLDTFTLDVDALQGQDLIDSPADIGVIGKRLQLEMYNTASNQDFSISKILVDGMELGGRP